MSRATTRNVGVTCIFAVNDLYSPHKYNLKNVAPSICITFKSNSHLFYTSFISFSKLAQMLHNVYIECCTKLSFAFTCSLNTWTEVMYDNTFTQELNHKTSHETHVLNLVWIDLQKRLGIENGMFPMIFVEGFVYRVLGHL